jgi:hypothetical protein
MSMAYTDLQCQKKEKNASKQPKTVKARGDWTCEVVEAEGKKPNPWKTKKRKKTKEKRVCQKLAPPGGMHPASDSFSEIDPNFGSGIIRGFKLLLCPPNLN